MGLDQDDRFKLSLDFLALEHYCQALIEVLSRRSKAQRRYQTLLELRQVLAFVYERAYKDAPLLERSQVRLDAFPAFAVVKVRVPPPLNPFCWLRIDV